MPLITVHGKLLAIAINKEVKWQNSPSQPFNTLPPFEVTCGESLMSENKQPALKPANYFIKDISFSEDGAYLVILTSYKDFYIYSTDNFTLICKHQLPRAASKVVFSFDSQFVLVADKTGDALIYKTKDQSDPGKKVFGHLSLLTDILMTRDNKYIITCDRDEKIKVSNYPGSYNIEAFCLGHREFITSIHFLPHNEKYLVSTSGDGTVRIWDYLLGKEIIVINVHGETNKSGVFDNFKQVMKIEDVEIDCLPIDYSSCCKVDDNSSLLAVSLHLNKSAVIYKITGEGSDMEYICVHNVTLEDCPVGFVILKDRLLVHLSGDKHQLLQEWKLKDDGTVEMGFCEVFEEDNAEGDNISVLYKRKFDNLQEYQNRKKKRIEGQK